MVRLAAALAGVTLRGMAYPEHYLLSFGGHQGELEETWNCGIRLAEYDSGVFGSVDQQGYLTTVAAPALSAWFSRAGSRIYSGAKLLWAKFNMINEQGHYADPSVTNEHSYGVGISGSQSSPLHPLQVCMVLSWRSDEAERGIASKGRIFSPRPCVTIDAAGDVDGGTRVVVADSAALLLNTLDITVGSGFMRPSIVSPGRGWPEQDNPGLARQIDRVVVDSALDIQRRRARSQTHEITSSPVSY